MKQHGSLIQTRPSRIGFISGLEQIQHRTDETLTALQLQDTSNRLQAMPINKVARYTVPRETKFYCACRHISCWILVRRVFRAISDFNGNRLLTADSQREADTLLKEIEKTKKRSRTER